MNMGLLRWYLPDANFRRAATHRLQEHFRDKSEQVWRSTRDWQSRLAPSRPRYGFSLNLVMRYYEWNLSLYRALQEHGTSQVEAGEFVETVAAEYYQPVAAAMFKLSRLRSAKRETRVAWLFRRIITRYFLSAPFRYRHFPSDTGVAFDVTVCPAADYFKDQGVPPEVTAHCACNLDYCMAREFGVDFVRTQTIANGAEYCDFRWEFRADGEAA
jgi:hypothetical protein